MALKIERRENDKGLCSFCMFTTTSYRIRYASDRGKARRSVAFPICKRCHEALMRESLKDKVNEIRTYGELVNDKGVTSYIDELLEIVEG